MSNQACVPGLGASAGIAMVADMAGAPGQPLHSPHAAASKPSTAGKAFASAAAMPEWDLSDLYSSPQSAELKRDLDHVKAEASAFKARYQGKLAGLLDDGADLASPIEEFEALDDRLSRIGAYAQLLYAANTADPVNAKFFGDIQDALTTVTTDLIFFTLELNSIDDARLQAAFPSSPRLRHYQPWLDDLRKEKPYQLGEKIEQLFHEKSVTGRAAWNRLFNETMTALRFDVAGEEMALEATLSLLSDQDGTRRRSAAQALAKVFKSNVRLFALITNTLAKDKEISDKWRGFGDVAASRHLANRVEPAVVDALVEAVRQRFPSLSHRYYAMKARWLGMDHLAYWDRNAPLPEKPERAIDWPEARSIVLDAYNGFAPQMADIARDFFDKRWIDAPVREGKSPGAFAHPTTPSVHPYILLNYQGKARDVMTLAHELGHGVHQVLANGQGPLMAPTPLTLAETASVFGEMLTFKALLAQTKDRRERKALIASKVEDMINTVVRQIAFYNFERIVHTERKAGELTAERLGEIWLDVQRQSLGPAVTLSEGYENYWVYIPHFIHSPFYVYAYAFGDCLVNSLYARYEEAETGFVEKYFAMLKAGGTKHHSELLAPFGLDASRPEFWAKGLRVIETMIDELESMEDKR